MIRVYTPAELAALCRDMHPTLGMQARGLLLLAGNDEPEAFGYMVDGKVYTLAQMLASNRDDEDVCDWLCDANPGDVFEDIQRVECVALPVFVEEPEPCSSCIGTGIGNPHVEGSRCSACNGRGYIRPSPAPSDEEPWAWNHFDPEPGDDTDEVAFIAGDRAYNVGKGERLARENDRRALEIQLNGAGRV